MSVVIRTVKSFPNYDSELERILSGSLFCNHPVVWHETAGQLLIDLGDSLHDIVLLPEYVQDSTYHPASIARKLVSLGINKVLLVTRSFIGEKWMYVESGFRGVIAMPANEFEMLRMFSVLEDDDSGAFLFCGP